MRRQITVVAQKRAFIDRRQRVVCARFLLLLATQGNPSVVVLCRRRGTMVLPDKPTDILPKIGTHGQADRNRLQRPHENPLPARLAIGPRWRQTKWPDESWGMVKLTPQQQAMFVQAEPNVFMPVKGGWGRKGATNVKLVVADPTTVRDALVIACRNVAPKTLAREHDL